MRKKRLILLGIIFSSAIIILFTSIKIYQEEQTVVQSMAVSFDENYKVEELLETLYKELEKNYGDLVLSFSPDERILTVKVKNQEFIAKNQIQIKKQINEIAKKMDMKDIKVELKTGL
ncbi:hypothetical protein [Rummeliibacillus pycnus]|uniref:hypothetical protein n=1 Tax=Rummeliibacillus pycnus TaxID=101070 RepID=UPI000C9A9FE5|nr:hypothetical protein [Rummeliibacillus pycnus]